MSYLVLKSIFVFYIYLQFLYVVGPNFNDIEYIVVTSFNKQSLMQYNSTRGYWIGFTNYSIMTSYNWNKDPLDHLLRKMEKKLLCYDNINFIQTIGNLSATPIIRLKLIKQNYGQHPVMLECSAYNFYPKQIKLTWLRNGQEVTEGVSYTDVIPDGQFYYQSHSYLEYAPTSGERISCMVEHSALSEPQTIVWGDSFTVEEKGQVAVGLCGLLTGSLLLTSGLIYYKKKSAAYIDA
uniref:Ig-like domain-containing protein n=1 Tax=Cyprinodon variegatus TaxID=28743 RepID=A0A3Q2CZX9_CYPVA